MDEKITSYKLIGLAIGLPLSIVSAIFYLVAYWSSFHINVFEYASIDDVVVTALYPLVAFFAINLVVSALFLVLFPVFTKRDNYSGITSEESRKAKRRIFISFSLFAVVSAIYIAKIGTIGYFYYEGAVIVGFLLGYNLRNSEYFSEQIPNLPVRLIVAILVFTIPLLSAAYGKNKAIDLKLGNKSYQYICQSQLNKVARDPSYSEIAGEMKYIGKIGDYFFFEEYDRSIRLSKFKDFERFVLTHQYEFADDKDDIDKCK